MTDTGTNEVILVDKPKGITSFDVIRILRKKLDKKKMGHAGTLDPLASGLMIVGIDGGTKKMTEFLKLPKVYVADILLGKRTDTGDLEGKVLEEVPIDEVNKERIADELKKFIGKHSLAVPMYSAIKVGGMPLYKRARKGDVSVPAPVKEMELTDAKLLGIEKNEKGTILRIEMNVTSGTYIRTLAEEFGRRLGYPATLSDLRRTSIGEYSVDNAMVL